MRRMHQLVGRADPAERLPSRRLAEEAHVEAPGIREPLEMGALRTVAEDDEHALVTRRSVVRARRDVVDDLVDALARHEAARAHVKAASADLVALRSNLLADVGYLERAWDDLGGRSEQLRVLGRERRRERGEELLGDETPTRRAAKQGAHDPRAHSGRKGAEEADVATVRDDLEVGAAARTHGREPSRAEHDRERRRYAPVGDDPLGREAAEVDRRSRHPRRGLEGAARPLPDARRRAGPSERASRLGTDHEHVVSLSLELGGFRLDEVPRRVTVVGGIARRYDGNAHR